MNGTTWRWGDNDLKVRSQTEAAHDPAGSVPKDMPLRDWGVSYAELEPFYDRFEYVAGVSGKAGNLEGKIQPGGNPFEAPRARDYPLPPLIESYGAAKFAKVASEMGYHPFLRPAANASKPYVNPDGARLGQCQYCGFCERFGCESNAKGSPHHHRHTHGAQEPKRGAAHMELGAEGDAGQGRQESHRRRLRECADRGGAGAAGRSCPALRLRAFNVHLMLLSGIGRPYDPLAGRGVVGSHYAYQGGAGIQLFFEGESFNPFIATGGGERTIDDFHLDPHFDRGPLGYIGGYTVAVGSSNGRPISYRPTPPGTPRWGSGVEALDAAKWYQSTMSIGAKRPATVMQPRQAFLDLDPVTYRNRFGQPLMRMTFDFKDNDVRLGRHAAEVCGMIGKAMKPSILGPPAFRTNWSVVPYQSTHNTGGAIMRAEPGTSALNTWLQSTGRNFNVFVLRRSAFPHNSAYKSLSDEGGGAQPFRTGERNPRTHTPKRPGMLT